MVLNTFQIRRAPRAGILLLLTGLFAAVLSLFGAPEALATTDFAAWDAPRSTVSDAEEQAPVGGETQAPLSGTEVPDAEEDDVQEGTAAVAANAELRATTTGNALPSVAPSTWIPAPYLDGLFRPPRV